MKAKQMWKQCNSMKPIFYYFDEYAIKIVNSKATGKRLVLNSSLVNVFAGCEGVYISMHPDSGCIAFTKNPEGIYYKFDDSGITISDESLIEEMIKVFDLDFSNKTSQTFVMHFKTYADVAMFFARLKEVE